MKKSQKLYEVEKIVGHSYIDGVKLYHIKWKGYPSSQNTYEPIEHLSNVDYMVKEYNIKFKEKENKKLKEK